MGFYFRKSLGLSLAAFALVATRASADMVKCREPNGSLYVGSAPPENCTPLGSIRPQSAGPGSSWSPGTLLPTPTPVPDTSKADAAEAAQKEIDHKRGAPAVAVQKMVVKRYTNGLFFEGEVANGAEFPVYAVQICIENGQRCQPVAPATLQPGSQGTFSFEVLSFNAPDYRISWDVLVPAEQ